MDRAEQAMRRRWLTPSSNPSNIRVGIRARDKSRVSQGREPKLHVDDFVALAVSVLNPIVEIISQ